MRTTQPEERMRGFPKQRLEWAREHGWTFVARRTIDPDLFGRLSWRGPGPRDRSVDVVGEIRGTYGTRDAFAHDRPLPVLRAEVRAQVSYGRISGVTATADLPVAYVLLDRISFYASIVPMPWAEGLTVFRNPFGTATAVWAQPGHEQLLMDALAPLLQNARAIVANGTNHRYLIGIGETQVLVGEPFDSDPRAALYRMGLADDVTTRVERAVAAR